MVDRCVGRAIPPGSPGNRCFPGTNLVNAGCFAWIRPAILSGFSGVSIACRSFSAEILLGERGFTMVTVKKTTCDVK
jgi:hypothetical protein